MTTPRNLQLHEVSWPITWRFEVVGPWGATHQEITADVPALADDPVASRDAGIILWTKALASASTSSIYLSTITTLCWKAGTAVIPYPLIPVYGVRGGATAPRQRSAVIVMHTSDPDGYGRRRLFLPGIPLDWTTPDLLTKKGSENVMALARGLFIGLADPIVGPDARWLLAYPRMFAAGPLGVDQVGFRYVNHLRVCQYVERAPEATGGIWP